MKRAPTHEDLSSQEGESKKKMFRIPKIGAKSPKNSSSPTSTSPNNSPQKLEPVPEEQKTDDVTLTTTTNQTEPTTTESTVSENNAELARHHYNNLQQIELNKRHESKIFNLRGFNNYVKSLVMSDFLGRLGPLGRGGATILDLGCGKGGDLGKWGLARPAHLVCVDIADVSVAQCEERYRERTYHSKANFIVADCSRDNLSDKFREHDIPDVEFDLVSCQFALHYGFESQAQAIRMIKNAVSHLKPGCFFFGTIPNSNYLVKKYRSQNLNPDSPRSSKFGNDVFYVDFLEPDRQNFPLFGAKYVFYLDGAVQALPEFLIHFPLLESMIREEGCECVLAEPFTDYIYKSRDTTSRHDDSARDSVPRAKTDELKDVSVLARTRGLNDGGTLLQEEWEVVACYMVFGFRKLAEDEREGRRDSKRRKVL